MPATINGREYPLHPQFVHDLRVELGLPTPAAPGSSMPAAERDYTEAVEVTIPLRGVSFRTVGGDSPAVFATWAFRRPDGSTATVEIQVPEEARSQLSDAQATGAEMVTGVYAATLDLARAARNAAWGIV